MMTGNPNLKTNIQKVINDIPVGEWIDVRYLAKLAGTSTAQMRTYLTQLNGTVLKNRQRTVYFNGFRRSICEWTRKIGS